MEIHAPPALSVEVRNAVLQREIARYVRHGYRVVSQTMTTAQLVRPKKFSFVFAFLWLLLWGVGLVIYLLYYAAKRDEQLYIEIDAGGNVIRS